MSTEIHDGEKQGRTARRNHTEGKSEMASTKYNISELLEMFMTSDITGALKLSTMVQILEDNFHDAAVKKIDLVYLEIWNTQLALEKLRRYMDKTEEDADGSLREHTQEVIRRALRITAECRNENVLPRKGDDRYDAYEETITDLLEQIEDLTIEWQGD